MKEPKLLINSETELGLGSDLISIGRASDNTVSFAEDTNVSRYHAEIERRGEDYWLIDLGSFNGTKLNGEKLDGEKPLNDRDEAVFGGTSRIEVLLTPKDEAEKPEDEVEPEKDDVDGEETGDAEPAAPPKKKSGFPIMLMVAALAVGLAVVCVVGAGLFYFTREAASCEAQARIITPEKGDTLKAATDVEIELTNGECVQKAVYTIEGKEFASSEEPPFSVKIEPSEFPEFGDGLNRNLKVILFDQDGKQITQSQEIAFFIETIEVEPPKETDTPPPTGDPTNPGGPPGGDPTNPGSTGKDVSIKDTIAMSGNVLKQFSGDNQYKFDQRFLQEVGKAASEFAAEGYFERAQKYRDVINIAFIREQNLDPPLGYILAMSRSKFSPKNNADGTGLWRMSNDFVVANSYNGLCGEETIASAAQNCAAKASALYLKALILNIFEGDTIYGIAAFGMSPQEADAWKATLPADRTDFWNVIKSPQQRQEVVNFFAAAMVAENPQKFGLPKDRPLSELYSVFMK